MLMVGSILTGVLCSMQGGIDFDELFETVGEPRTPFTDIVFTLVGTPSYLRTYLAFVL